MIPRWLTGPFKPKVFLAIAAYFLISCVVAGQIDSGSAERISSPIAATILAVMAAGIALTNLVPLISQTARDILLRADTAFGFGDKANLAFQSLLFSAFAVGLTVVAFRGVS